MGSLRALLAVSVVFLHAFDFILVGGALAVQMFYAISGFLISFILVEARSYDSVSSFYLNRLLRLFPAYYLIAGLTLISATVLWFFLGIMHPAVEAFGRVNGAGMAALAATNVFLLGQDWIMFTGVKDGALQFTKFYQQSEVQVWKGLLVPQSWTLGIELSFYLLAPWILLRPRIMFPLLALSIAVRACLLGLGLGMKDPWTYRFFPAELSLFLLGALAHQITKPLYERYNLLTQRSSWVVTLAMLLFCGLFSFFPYRSASHAFGICLLLLALPFLFDFACRYPLDRKLGELSYPIYISHMLIIWLAGVIFKGNHGYARFTFAESILIVLITVVSSIAINHTVEIQVSRFRRRVKHARS